MDNKKSTNGQTNTPPGPPTHARFLRVSGWVRGGKDWVSGKPQRGGTVDGDRTAQTVRIRVVLRPKAEGSMHFVDTVHAA